MTETGGRQHDVDVSVGNNSLRGIIMSGLGLAVVPVVLVFGLLAAVLAPLQQSSATDAIAQAIVDARAGLINQYVSDAITAAEGLSEKLPQDTPEGPIAASDHGLVDTTAVMAIPLNELGTVNLAPGRNGIDSHIGVDLVRRAFVGEAPPPEVVDRSEKPYALLARPYGSPPAGVVLVRLPIADLESRLAGGDTGDFRIMQTLNAKTVQVAGSGDSRPFPVSTKVPNTYWRVEYAPKGDWLAALSPNWIALIGAAIIAIIGVLAGFLLIVFRVPQLLNREVNQIIESSELRVPLKLQIPQLLPLAKLLRQLSLLHRRQIVTRKRDTGRTDPAPDEDLEAHTEPDLGPGIEVEHIDELPPEAALAAPVIDEDEVSSDGIPDFIFRETCIRGDRTQLTDEMIDKIGRAIAVLARDRDIQTMLVAHDARPGSAGIGSRLIRALLASGVDVIDLGEVPATILHFATHESDADSGVMITGGDGDSVMTGLELVFNRAIATGDVISEIPRLIRNDAQAQGSGRTIKLDVTPDYVDRVVMDVALALPLKVVIDHDFGASADIAPVLFEAIDCEVVNVNNDPHQRPDADRPLETMLKSLGERVVAEGADIGVVFDAEGDRLHTVSETGNPIPTDQLLMFLARDMLERNPGTDVVFDIAFSRQFAPFVTRAGGRPLISRGGRAFVREKMQESGALIGGEFSGHIFMNERWYPFNDPFYACARILELLSSATAGYNDLMNELPQSLSTPELLLPMSASGAQTLMERLEAESDFPSARVATLDGLRLDYANGWGLVRKAPERAAIAFRFEANDTEGLERIQAVLSKAILNIAPDLKLPF